MTTQGANDGARYLELARSALLGNNGQEAYDYANKLLEIDPTNLSGLETKMLAIQLLATLGDLRIPETIACAMKMVACATPDVSESTIDKVNTFFLNRALELMRLAVTKIEDVEEIKQTFTRFAGISIFTCGQNTLKVDTPYINMVTGLTGGAIQLKQAVRDEYIHNRPDYQSIVNEIVDLLARFYKSLQARYKIYGASLAEEAFEAQRNNLNALKSGLPTPEEIAAQARERREQYWREHPVEKADIDRQLQELKAQQSALQAELDKLGMFAISQKKAIRDQMQQINKQVENLESELKRDR